MNRHLIEALVFIWVILLKLLEAVHALVEDCFDLVAVTVVDGQYVGSGLAVAGAVEIEAAFGDFEGFFVELFDFGDGDAVGCFGGWFIENDRSA